MTTTKQKIIDSLIQSRDIMRMNIKSIQSIDNDVRDFDALTTCIVEHRALTTIINACETMTNTTIENVIDNARDDCAI